MSGRPTAPAANDNAVRRWRIAAIAGYALAAALAAFIGLRPPPAPAPAPVASLAPDTFAVLLPTGSTAPVLVVLPRADGAYRVRATGALNVAANHDLQLWALPAGATKPVSLGLLPVSRHPGLARRGDGHQDPGQSRAEGRLTDRAANRGGGVWRDFGAAVR